MKKKSLLVLLVLCSGLLLPLNGQAENSFGIDNIETILEDNMLNEVSNRYASVILSFLPEEATRFGYNSADDKLNIRTPQHSKQTLLAFQTVQNSFDKINEKRLSPAKKTERIMLQNALDSSMLLEEQKQHLQNPLYYTQALDSVHDLFIKQLSSPLRQRLNLLSRLAALPEVADQAEKNLSSIDPVLAQRAMEKAYYAFLSLNEWNQYLLEGAADNDAKLQITHITQNAKGATKRLFERFRILSQQASTADFRLGSEDYFNWLRRHYQLDQKPAALLKKLDGNLQQAQNNLTQALEPFTQPVEEEEIVLTDENGQPVSQPVPAAKKQKKSAPIRNAQDFYAAAKTFMKAEADPDPLTTLQNDAQGALLFFTENRVLPSKNITFRIAKLPQYYILSTPYLFVPPFGNQLTPKSDFYLRIPAGNALNQQTLFDQDFNTPTRKLMISGQLVPGRYYQEESMLAAPLMRRLYPSASLANGWESYAKRLAKKYGYLDTNEDLLVLAWDEYRHALAAWMDVLLHTQQYSYDEAMEFLTQTHGLEQTQAENMLRDIAENPGEAVSYFIGLEALENAHKKYSKKFGKKFDEADFHAKLFRIGHIPPNLLDKELARLYKQDKKK